MSWGLLTWLLLFITILALDTVDQNGCFSSSHCVCIPALREKVGGEEHILFSIENSSMLCVPLLPIPRGPDHSHVTTHSFKENRKLYFFPFLSSHVSNYNLDTLMINLGRLGS